MRLGIVGGTFDPIHHGHLFIAEEARVRLGLDRVTFIPNAVSPFKTAGVVSAPEVRFEMTRLATADNPAFEVSRMEINRPGPSYTSDTLRSLHALYPGAELFFIAGADAVADIEAWHEPDVVLNLAHIVAAARPGYPFGTITRSLRAETVARIEILDTLPVDISGTEIRDRVRAGLPIRYLTPTAVLEYIDRHRLYG